MEKAIAISNKTKPVKHSPFFTRAIQPKLTINQPNDVYEQQADAVAEKVMQMNSNDTVQGKFFSSSISTIQRKCAHCEEEERKMQRKELNDEETTVDNDLEKYVDNLDSNGQSLPGEVRDFYEPRIGYDFSKVKIHTDSIAAKSAQSINALAYTTGNNIVFNSGQYSPNTNAGKRLLGHELTHVIQQAPGSVMRQCLTGAPCTPPIAGAPGQFVTTEEGRRAPDVAERVQQAGRARRAERPVAGTVPTVEETQALRDIQADRHGQSATNLERLATENGINLSAGNIAGIFIDRAISANYGAYATICIAFGSFVNPPTTDPTRHCVFVPVSLEDQAQQYYSNPRAQQIGSIQRNLWLGITLATLRHERQHVIFNTSPHAYVGSGCTRATVLYTSGTHTFTVNYYLSELSAGLSEFLSYYNVLISTGDASIRTFVLQNWLRHKVENSHESIKGIITALRCRCSCSEVDSYIRDTFTFTTSSWPLAARVILNSLLANYPNLNWPIQGRDPACVDDCMRQVDEFLGTSQAGGTRPVNDLTFRTGIGLNSGAYGFVLAYRRWFDLALSGRLQLSVGADFDLLGIAMGIMQETRHPARDRIPEFEFGSLTAGIRQRINLWGGAGFGGITLGQEVGLDVGRFRIVRATGPEYEYGVGFIAQTTLGAEFYIPANFHLSLEVGYRFIRPLNPAAENLHELIFGVRLPF